MEKLLERLIAESGGLLAVIVAGSFGGLIDYANQVVGKTKQWSLLGCVVHVSTACFFGWLLSRITSGLGYEGDMVGAAAGMGGFLGTRAIDIALSFINRVTTTPKV